MFFVLDSRVIVFLRSFCVVMFRVGRRLVLSSEVRRVRGRGLVFIVLGLGWVVIVLVGVSGMNLE